MGCFGVFSGLLVLKVLKQPLIVPHPRTEATYSRGRTRSGGFVMLNRQWTIPAGAQRSHGHVRLNVQIMFYISMSETFSFAWLDATKCLKVFPPSSKQQIISLNWNWPAHKRDRRAWAWAGALSMRSTCCLALLLAAQWAPIDDAAAAAAAAWSGLARGLCNLL